VLHEEIHLPTLSSLQRFTNLLYVAEQKWDSIRRIPYSTPGRWVRTLDVSVISRSAPTVSDSPNCGAPRADDFLTQLVPYLPFLEALVLDAGMRHSRRFLYALAEKDGAERLRSLTGLYVPDTSIVTPAAIADDSIPYLLRQLSGLEELGLVGPGVDALELDAPALDELDADSEEDKAALGQEMSSHLSRLRVLSAISLPAGPTMAMLIVASLPRLREVTVTPYEGVPGAQTSALVKRHGPKLDKLAFSSPGGGWPTILYPSPSGILSSYPSLSELLLCSPFPDLFLPDHPSTATNLRSLTISRPASDLLGVLINIHLLPKLAEVRIRDVRWLRAGMAVKAREAGVQGEMREWRRRLARRGVVLLDADGSTGQAAGNVDERSLARNTGGARTT
jgi:hypothetical protein